MKFSDCNRPCDSTPMICQLSLIAKAQYTDEEGRLADGRKRSVLTFNGTLPGPPLYVCEGDTVYVTLINEIEDGPITNADGSPSSTTLHFHGIREVGRKVYFDDEKEFGPWSDGVPFVSQCPVGNQEGKNTFVYKFEATQKHFNAPPGTYWYHSHLGAQRTNGLEGALVIRPRSYSQDDLDHDFTVVLQEWYESPTNQAPISILVNGKSKYSPIVRDSRNYDAINKYLRGVPHTFNKIDNPSKRSTQTTNYEVFQANDNENHRFRILGLIGQNLPIRFSIVNPIWDGVENIR